MKFFDKFSRFSFVAIVVIIIGGIVEIVALATPYWTLSSTQSLGNIGHSGLWLNCKRTQATVVTTVSCSSYADAIAGWMVAVRALNVIGMIFGSVALVFMGLFTFLYSEKWKKIIRSSALISALLAGSLIIIGAVLYGVSVSQGKAPVPYQVVSARYIHSLSWSFALSLVAAILFVISGVMMGFSRKPRINS